jgi:2'-5' RNA ligase
MAPNLSKAGFQGIRTFVAIELPDPVRAVLTGVEDRLSEHAAALKIVAPELLHLTMRFLGGLSGERVTAVQEAARSAASGQAPFRLHLSSVGAFGGRMPRVVWVGIREDGGLAALRALFTRLEDELHVRGFDRERRALSPHLTLARVRERATREDIRSLGETVMRLAAGPPLAGSFEVRELTVMRSDLGPRGPRYTPLSRARLLENVEG